MKKLLPVLFTLLICGSIPAQGILTCDGQTSVKIYLPKTYGKAVQLASTELQYFLKRITGAEFPIFYGPVPPRGTSGIFLKIRPESEWRGKESAQSFTVTEYSKGSRTTVTITGNTSLAVLYGVYQYLENLGVRFYAPGEIGTNIPNIPVLTVGNKSQTYTPKFESRIFSLNEASNYHFSGNGPEAEWEYALFLMRNKAHISRSAAKYFDFGLNPIIGGHYIKPMTGLTRDVVKKLMVEKPERFALVTGPDFVQKRRYNDGQVCFTNQENIDTAIANVLKYFEEHEAATDNDLRDMLTAPLGLSDTNGVCECENCKKIAGDDDFWRERLVWTFWNTVAKAVAKKYPNRYITNSAIYMEMKYPPEDITVEKNIHTGVTFVYAHEKTAVGEPTFPFNKTYAKELNGVRKKVSRMGMYCYTSFPWTPTTKHILSLAERCNEMDMYAFEVECMNRAEYIWPLIHSLMHYTWDPSINPEERLKSYCLGYFGEKNGKLVYDFFEEMTQNSFKMDRINYGGAGDTSLLFPDEFIKKYRPALSRAVATAAGKEKIRMSNLQRPLEGMFRMAETYRLYQKALNTRDPEAISAFRKKALGVQDYWMRAKLDEVCTPNKTLHVLATRLLSTDFANLKPVTRKILVGQKPGDEIWMKELFAGYRVPTNIKNLTPLPEVWRFHTAINGERTDVLDPAYDDSKDFQDISSWNYVCGQGIPNQIGGFFYYRVKFPKPDMPAGKRVYLRIGSLDDTGVFYLNGKEIGRHDDPRDWDKSHEFDVTDVLQKENVLVVKGYDSGGAEGVWRPSALYTKD